MKVALVDALAIDCAGFSTGCSLLACTGFFAACLVFFAIAGAFFAVITWTTSDLVSSLPLGRPSVDGARACARAPALKAAKTDAVASAKKIRRPRTSARYAGNQKPWQAFFSGKIMPAGGLPSGRPDQLDTGKRSVVREVVGSEARRRPEALVAVDEGTAAPSRTDTLVWSNNRRAPGGQTKD